MVRLLTLVLLAAVGCGGSPRPPKPERPPLAEGTGIYPLRYNAAPCLRDDLHLEARTPAGWERVAVEDADEDGERVGDLLRRFRESPEAVISVRVTFTDRVRFWDGNHASRILRLVELDPVSEGEEEQ